MFSSFSTALSALNADSTAIDVVGNNLANLNTYGFKTSDVSFQDLVAQSLSGGPTQVGSGVAAPTTQMDFSQGSIQSTGGALDARSKREGFSLSKPPMARRNTHAREISRWTAKAT
jgi:flagellar hook protein FlgE